MIDAGLRTGEPTAWLAEGLPEHRWQPQPHGRAAAAARYGRPDARPSTGGFVIATRL